MMVVVRLYGIKLAHLEHKLYCYVDYIIPEDEVCKKGIHFCTKCTSIIFKYWCSFTILSFTKQT